MKKEEFLFQAVGHVVNEFNETTAKQLIKEKPSTIVIYPEYEDALYRIEDHEYVDVFFVFHKVTEYKLHALTQSREEKGVFASRSPFRPNTIGHSSVKLIERRRNELIVSGLDALNGSPVLDIKCSDTSLFSGTLESNELLLATLRRDPRIEIKNHIVSGKMDLLMIKAAQMHGHYCPGLALGVMAATHAMKKLFAESDGLEDLLAIVETNNCFSDGIQFVTACSFGNNALIFHDLGKMAFSLCKRNGQGKRITVRPESKEIIRKILPDNELLYEKVVASGNRDEKLVGSYKKAAMERAFSILTLPFDDLCKEEDVFVDIPGYAGVHASFICELCKESVMSTRMIKSGNKSLCLKCADKKFASLDGDGLHL